MENNRLENQEMEQSGLKNQEMEQSGLKSQEIEQNGLKNQEIGNKTLAGGVPENSMTRNAPYFLGMAFVFSICFAVSFYRNYIGITFPLITAVMLAICALFLKKEGIAWKRSSWLYAGISILLGISVFVTTNVFVIFFNTVGILLLLTVLMMRQMYDDRTWSFGQYLGNMLFLYLNMIPEVAAPFIHLINYRKKHRGETRKNKKAKYVVIGVLIGLPMLIVIIELLSSADQIFSQVIGEGCHKLFRQIVFSPNVFLVMLLMIVGFFGIYSFFSALALRNMPQYASGLPKKNPLIAVTFLSMVAVVYVIFCGIQVMFLFTGGMLLPEGYTYAEYARQGFFQLMFVCSFNLILVVSCIAVFEENKALKLLLLLCSGCTYVMIASSAFRMILYIHTYHLSFLRVLVLWFLAMLAVLMAGIVVAVTHPRFGLFRYCVAVIAVFYLVFSFGRTDVLIAEYNVAHMGQDISYEDLQYLTRLSMDVVPVLSRYTFEHENGCQEENTNSAGRDAYDSFEDWYYDGADGTRTGQGGCRRCLLEQTFQHVLDKTEDMSIRTFHVSKYLARRAALKW